jgi:hypothetical protein
MAEIDQHAARREALERVVERVTAWQETATEGTVREELDRGLAEASVTLTAEQRDDVAERISEGRAIDLDLLSAEAEGGGPA